MKSRGLGRRIHGSVEDTKLSTNKQHTLSLNNVPDAKKDSSSPPPAEPPGQEGTKNIAKEDEDEDEEEKDEEKRCKQARHIFVDRVVQLQLWRASSLCFCAAIVGDKYPTLCHTLLSSRTYLQYVQCHFGKDLIRSFGDSWDYLELAMQLQYNKRNR